jgi:hypothetical protein
MRGKADIIMGWLELLFVAISGTKVTWAEYVTFEIDASVIPARFPGNSMPSRQNQGFGTLRRKFCSLSYGTVVRFPQT